MNSRRFIVITLSVVLVFLIVFASINVVVDPLFQYHQPWFGLKPVVTYSRYQNPGIAKNFDYENAMIGNSLSENFRISVVNDALGGETAKLTMAGSHPVDWVHILNILKTRDPQPKHILFNLDPYILYASADADSSLPEYLYNSDWIDNVSYLLNMKAFFDFTFDTIFKNVADRVPDYDKIYLWEDDWEYGEKVVLNNYQRPDIDKKAVDVQPSIESAKNNVVLLSDYFVSMPDTEFIFFFAPFSMIYWDSVVRQNTLEAHKELYLSACKELLNYDNVSVFFWLDNEILEIMGDLNNYIDEAHYSPQVCETLAQRIKDNQGCVTIENYMEVIETFFDYIKSFDYEVYF